MIRILLRRKQLGMTQEQLANEINVKRAVISKYENGNIAPSIAQIDKLAKALNTTPAYLEGLIDDPNIPLVDINKIIKRATELKNDYDTQQKLYDTKIKPYIITNTIEALERHIDAVLNVCSGPDIRPDAVPDRIKIATELIQNNKWLIDGSGGGNID